MLNHRGGPKYTISINIQLILIFSETILCLNLDDGTRGSEGEESGRLLGIFGFSVVVKRLDQDCGTAESDQCEFEQHLGSVS